MSSESAEVGIVEQGELEITLPYHEYGVHEHKRIWATLNLTFFQANKFARCDVFTAGDQFKKSRGEQRATKDSHVKKLKNAHLLGHFTPAGFTYGVGSKKAVTIDEEKKTVTIRLNKSTPLKTLDGGHRLKALQAIYAEVDDPADRAEIDNMILPGIIELNGNTQEDFVRLQAGLAMDKTHLFGLRARGGFDLKEKLQEYYPMVIDLAHRLNSESRSPITNMIRFDTRSQARVPLTAISKDGAADGAVSLFGTAKICNKHVERIGQNNLVDWMFDIFANVWEILKEDCPDAVSDGRLLDVKSQKVMPIQLYIGVANMVAYRLHLLNEQEITEKTKTALIASVNDTFISDLDSKWNSGRVREAMGEFASRFFADFAEDADFEIGMVGGDAASGGGIPITLCELI